MFHVGHFIDHIHALIMTLHILDFQLYLCIYNDIPVCLFARPKQSRHVPTGLGVYLYLPLSGTLIIWAGVSSAIATTGCTHPSHTWVSQAKLNSPTAFIWIYNTKFMAILTHVWVLSRCPLTYNLLVLVYSDQSGDRILHLHTGYFIIEHAQVVCC